MKQKLMLAALVIGSIVFADISTKRWALESLRPGFIVESAVGVPMTLAFNTGVAFGLPLPSAGRWIIIFATLVVLYMLGSLFIRAERNDWLRLMSIELVAAGAIGNLIDRVRWDVGVVDFIGPINLGIMHWPIFNIADMAITTGAVLLGISLWREESAAAVAAEPVHVPRTAEETGS
ncbi:MAG: signal peptidase II [Gemmatimonadetes bacterium]|nr:signal peptidase II [Gemmatimonadota bacterium]